MMRLVAFRIENCFGFIDSDPVSLDEPSGLVYLLGRNSSGKTSFLTALANFSPSHKPKAAAGFLNYDPSGLPALLKATFRGDKLGVSSLLAWCDKELRTVNKAVDQDECKPLFEAIDVAIRSVYTKPIESFNEATTVEVSRDAEGDYAFGARDDAIKRLATMTAKIEAVWEQRKLARSQQHPNHVNVGGSWLPFTLPSAQAIENKMMNFFPRLTFFGKAYNLADPLPDVLQSETLGKMNALTKRFVDLLEIEKVQRLLTTDSPRLRSELQQEMQSRVDRIVESVNRAVTKAGAEPILQIELSITAKGGGGLQIDAVTNGNHCFYRHISDNTKYLFAYYLYHGTSQVTNQILLFDEPNNGFHATAQEELLRFLKSLCASGNQVVVSTHSEHLLDPLNLTGIRLMASDDSGYLYVRNKWYSATRGKGDFLATRPLFDAIGLKYGANHLSVNDRVVVASGLTELLYLRAFCKIFEAPPINIAPATGDDPMLPLISFIISQQVKFKILVDAGPVGGKKSIRTKIVEAFAIPEEYFYEVGLPPEFQSKRGAGIEDIFSKNDFAQLLRAIGVEPNADFNSVSNSEYMTITSGPKRIVAERFLSTASPDTRPALEPSTVEAVSKLLEFCREDKWFGGYW